MTGDILGIKRSAAGNIVSRTMKQECPELNLKRIFSEIDLISRRKGEIMHHDSLKQYSIREDCLTSTKLTATLDTELTVATQFTVAFSRITKQIE